MMKKKIAGVLLSLVCSAPLVGAQIVSDFDDIQFWAGDGVSATHRAAMVLQWNLGSGAPYSSHSLVWGYGWNSGNPNGWDMLTDIVADDPSLSLVEHPSYSAVFGLYYDFIGDDSGFTPGNPGDLGGPENGSANNASNYYQEGWFGGYWEYSVFGGDFTYDVYEGPPIYAYVGTFDYDVAGDETYSNVVWFNAGIGAESRLLADGYWDAWSFSPGFDSQSVVQPTAAVPEPGSACLLFTGLLCLSAFGRTRSRH